MIHTYSLIHDDLPAMDNDDLRRENQPTIKSMGGNRNFSRGWIIDGCLPVDQHDPLNELTKIVIIATIGC